MHRAVCDDEALLPLRSLIEGPLTTLDDLAGIERFVRTVVLHDEVTLQPFPRMLRWTRAGFKGGHEEIQTWAFYSSALRSLIEFPAGSAAYVSWSHETDSGFLLMSAKDTEPEFRLSPELVRLASDYAGRSSNEAVDWYRLNPDLVKLASDYAGRGSKLVADGYLTSLKHILATVTRGGSALLESEFGNRALTIASDYPESLFCELDKKWQRYSREVEKDGFGLLVPPVLGIVLTRCARRDAIPAVIRDLRDEWARAREKVWTLLDAQRRARTLNEAAEIRRELSDASKLFAPEPTEHDSRPVRVLWEIIAAATAGAGIAALSGGRPIVGAVTGAMAHVPRSVPALLHEFGPAVFGRGAFDLARRVRRAVSEIELGALARLVSDTEKKTWGLGSRLSVTAQTDVPNAAGNVGNGPP